jgi:ribose transport system substrate-binding protein
MPITRSISRGLLLAAIAAAGGAFGGAALAQNVTVVTPYLAQPGSQFMIEGFQAAAEEKGWTVNVIDTQNDVAAVIARIEDAVNQGVDAIVINVDPTQVTAGLQAAKNAGIPVVGMDSGADPLLATNVTSNGYAMAAETATYVVDRTGGAGNVVMFVFDPYPPVRSTT